MLATGGSVITWGNRPAWQLLFFFFNDTATTEIYTLSLHDALPISAPSAAGLHVRLQLRDAAAARNRELRDRKSTRLNSSHSQISYAVFCLKKKRALNTRNFRYGISDIPARPGTMTRSPAVNRPANT